MRRLEHLKLWALEERRVRAYLIEVYKIIHGISSVSFDTLLEYNSYGATRGHSLNLMKKSVNWLESHFFSERVINIWNSLDNRTVASGSINIFKGNLERLRQSKEICWQVMLLYLLRLNRVYCSLCDCATRGSYYRNPATFEHAEVGLNEVKSCMKVMKHAKLRLIDSNKAIERGSESRRAIFLYPLNQGWMSSTLLSWRQTIDKVGQLYRLSDAGFTNSLYDLFVSWSLSSILISFVFICSHSRPSTVFIAF